MLLAGLLALVTLGTAATAGEVAVNGSTTVQPIALEIQNCFPARNPGINLSVEATGSGDGIAALINGTTDIAMHSREMKALEYAQAVENGVFPVIYPVARDKIAVAVHPSNPIEEITMDQLRAIWMGEITNWSELGGSDSPILVGSRDTSSGTFGAWKQLVLGSADYAAPHVTVVASNAVMQETIRSEPNAVGYVGLAYVEGLKVLTVDGEPASSPSYPVARSLFISTNGQPTGDVAVVVDAFIGVVGQCAAIRHKYIPVWACDCSCTGVLPQ